MATPDDLADLVDNPSETLSAEYKSQLDLSDGRSKANFARHVAALANHGGGYLVFGFNDNLTRASQTEFPNINRDAVAGIVKSYLDPPFQCEVRVATARGGARHTIVVVPSHGSVPICAKRDGPQDAKGRTQGISSGTHYIRKPGPASEPILTPSDWAPLIRRCALAERGAILAAIDVALKGGQSEDNVERRLREWHEALARSYRKRLASAEKEETIERGVMQFSFGVHQDDEGMIAHDELLRIVERCNADADAVTRMHWGPFVTIHRAPVAPRYRTDPDLGNDEREFLEAAVIEAGGVMDTSDMWRVSNDGLASVIKGWWEDMPQFEQTPKACLSPNWLAKEVAGFVLFARAFANNFESATAVTFRCEWTGLKGRKPFDHNHLWHLMGRVAEDDRRVSSATIPLAEMNNGWAAPAALLMGPLVRAIGLSHTLNAKWLSNQVPNWARHP